MIYSFDLLEELYMRFSKQSAAIVADSGSTHLASNPKRFAMVSSMAVINGSMSKAIEMRSS